MNLTNTEGQSLTPLAFPHLGIESHSSKLATPARNKKSDTKINTLFKNIGGMVLRQHFQD